MHENKAVAWSEIHWEAMLGENPPEFLWQTCYIKYNSAVTVLILSSWLVSGIHSYASLLIWQKSNWDNRMF